MRACNSVRLVDPDLPALVEHLCAPGGAEAALADAAEALIELYFDGSDTGGGLRLACAINGVPVHAFAALPPAACWRRLTLSAGTRDLLPLLANDIPDVAVGAVAVSGLTPLASVAL